jgi:sodium ion-translocating decarboxylase beta subunit
MYIGSPEFFFGGPFPGSHIIMLLFGAFLVYLGIGKKFEALLLVPIGFSMMAVNLFPALMGANFDITAPAGGTVQVIYVQPMEEKMLRIDEGTPLFQIDTYVVKAPYSGELTTKDIAVHKGDIVNAHDKLATLENVSLFVEGAYPTGFFSRLVKYGILWDIIPLFIFVGLGALTDFAPLIADPKKFILGAAAQLGVYFVFYTALLVGFTMPEAASIGIIGGADGPTTIYLTSKLAPHLLCATAPAAYTYMAMVPLIQPPVIRLLTTKKERAIYMKPQLRKVSHLELILFPFILMIISVLIVPPVAPIITAFMIGNLLRVSGVTERLSRTASESFIDIVTILLGLSVGGIMSAENFLSSYKPVAIFVMGIVAFAVSTAGGVLIAKLMNLFLKEKINPMIGAAGVSAVPMSARVVQRMGQQANPRSFLLMHAMGPNAAGVIGTAIAAGFFLIILG